MLLAQQSYLALIAVLSLKEFAYYKSQYKSANYYYRNGFGANQLFRHIFLFTSPIDPALI